MAINLLYGCAQIETSSPDLAATRRFMIDALGARPVEQLLARQIAELIPGNGYDVDHLECGEAVFQINQPSPTMTFNGRKSIHQAYLDRIGPSVTNLNFYVDDIVHARELLAGMGAPAHIEGSSAVARALADYGPANSRQGAEQRPFLFMGARALIGFDLEIMEPNFLRFSEQTVQYPAFVQPRPASDRGNLTLQRLVVVVSSLQRTYDNLVRLFLPACRSQPYGVENGQSGKSFRIWLGGIEIEYCEPLVAIGELAEELERFGPGVVTIAFAARDVPGVLAGCRDHAADVREGFDPLGTLAENTRHHIACRARTGFDVVIEPYCEPAL